MRLHIIRSLIACTVLLGITGCMGHRAGAVHYEYRQADGIIIKATVYRSVGTVEPKKFPDLGIQVSLPSNVMDLSVITPKDNRVGQVRFNLAVVRFRSLLLENRPLSYGTLYLDSRSDSIDRLERFNGASDGRLTGEPIGEYYALESEPNAFGPGRTLTVHRINVVSSDGAVLVAEIERGNYEDQISDPVRREEIRKEDEAMIRAILESIKFIE